MNKYNQVTLQGRISFDPEVKELKSGKRVGKLNISCKSGRNGTLFMGIDVWDDNLIGTMSHLKKGEEIKVKGELRSESWVSATGEKRMKHVVVAEDIQHAADGIQKDIEIMPF